MRACRTKGRCHEGSKSLAARSSDRVVGTATLAADFPPPLPAAVEPVEFGWYLRGDVGVGQLHANQLEYFPNAKNAATDFAIEHSALGDTTFVGFGIGYNWNRWSADF